MAEGSALLIGGGDEPQPDNLVKTDAELVAAMLEHTTPVEKPAVKRRYVGS